VWVGMPSPQKRSRASQDEPTTAANELEADPTKSAAGAAGAAAGMVAALSDNDSDVVQVAEATNHEETEDEEEPVNVQMRPTAALLARADLLHLPPQIARVRDLPMHLSFNMVENLGETLVELWKEENENIEALGYKEVPQFYYA
ncbi:hypothetical protein PFISCL1PPCAC_27945, partial [Pristionchus fissidentatus]